MITSELCRKCLCAALAGALLLAACDSSLDPTISVVVPSDAEITVVSGNDQAGPVNSILPVPLAVRVTARGGRPVEGVRIRWSVVPAGGSVQPPTTPSATDKQGIARVERRLAGTAGLNTTIATIEELLKEVRFTAIGHVQGATRLSPFTGDPLSRTDTVLSTRSYRVLVLDHNDQPVQGVAVSWTGSAGALSSTTSTSDALGVAEVSHTHGIVPGTYELTASVTGLAGSPVRFGARATPGRVTTFEPVSGDSQVVIVDRHLEQPFVVHLADAYGNSIPGMLVSWSAVTNGDTTLLGTDITAPGFYYGPQPVSVYNHLAGSEPGAYTVTARVPAVPELSSIAFTFTVVEEPDIEVSVYDYDYNDYWCWYYGICGFSPSAVQVDVGKAVLWVWKGTAGHDVVFEDDPTEPISSATRTTGSHGRTFTEPGTYRYRCTVHSTDFTYGMVGVVTVVE